MKPSRKTAAASASLWHALEVPVPERSRLETVAGCLPGRPSLEPSTVVQAIAAALAERVTGVPAAVQLVAPSRRVGNEWLETLVRLGHPVADVHVTTLSALAFDIVADRLAATGLMLAPPRAKLVAAERVLAESRPELRAFTAAAGSTRRLAQRVLRSLESLRNAGLSSRDVARGLRHSDKAHDLCILLDRYSATLGDLGLIDQAGELALAIECVRDSGLPTAFTRLLVPDDLDLTPLERRLLDALEAAPGVAMRSLATDPPLPAPPAAIDAARFRIFRAAGEANEVRHVLRTCLATGLRLDEIEIVHTDAATYPALVREVVAALHRPLADPAAGGSHDQVPATFAEGLPLVDAKPGRALTGWLTWRRDGHPQAGLERLLRDGVLDLTAIVSDAPRSSALVRGLRGVKIGRGLGRTVAMLTAAAARAHEQPPETFARHQDDDDRLTGDDPTATELAARKMRITQRLSALAALAKHLAACEGGPEATAEQVLTGARRFVETLCPAASEFDGNARRMILDEIDAMLAWQGHAGMAAHDMLDWLAQLPAELVVLGAGPRPGCLHVSGLAGGGHSGRPCTFVLGLDENRFPGGGAADPVLTDGDRGLLNESSPGAQLPVARDAAPRTLELLRRLLARARGSVALGYSCRDMGDDTEVFPSPALVSLHGQAVGNPLATVDDLLESLPPPETLVPASPGLALDESQWWLATLGPHARCDEVQAALAAHRGHLADGQVAARARASADFTPHDGHVPEAGAALDPRARHGRAASPASLETLAACPRKFFFRYGLGIEPLERFDDDADRWLTPLDAGSLLHTVLERFMRGLIERAELPEASRHLDELLTILDEELEAGRRRQPPLTELAFAARRDALRTAMHTFLHDEERSCRETGRRPLALEAAIGVEPAGEGTPFDCREPVVVTLAAGEAIKLRGRIDRIDVRDDGASPTYALWDYKSGSGYGFPAMAAADPFAGGRKLQHGLYVVMLRTRLADPACPVAGGAVERFGYFFPTRAGKGRRLEWTAEQLAECTALVRRLAEIARQGIFLPTDDPADCSFCDFAAACGDASRVTREAARLVGGSQPLRDLFGTLRRARQPRPLPGIRRHHEAPLTLTPHPAVPVPPPDEPVRQRIRADLGTTLLVEAAAGTGKTTCMVERMLALVRTGTAKPEGIVAVTFTKKAAGELRRRFREKLQRAVLEASDPVEQARLGVALERADSMVIGTIHSFAGRLLRERPLEAGVDPGFRELDESADRLLRRQAWREFVTAAPADHPRLLADLDAVGLRLGDLSRLFAERFATYGDVEDWPAPATSPPDMATVVTMIEAFARRIEAEEFSAPGERGTDDLMNALEQFARMVRRCDTSSLVAVMELLEELDRSPKVTQKYWSAAGADEKERKAAQKAAALGWQAAWEHLRDTVARPALWQWRAHRYPVAIAALQAALAVYDRLRGERGGLSFQDLLCKAARLLVGQPDVRRSFRGRHTHLLVDEFQDTDPVQAEMLLLLTATDPAETDWKKCVPAAGSLFVVGDPKQSLYRFRRADIVTYSAVREIISRHGDVLALTTNFRSRSDLVDWANDVFTTQFPAQATVESPSFTPSSSGRREAPPAGVEQGWLTGLRALRMVRSGAPGAVWAEQEAREIASFIRSAIDAGLAVPRTLDEAGRGLISACRPGDFLLVARERKHLGIYAAALHAAGLPVDVTGTLGEDQAEPLRALRTCLAAVADPDDPVAMLALLRCEVFGFSDGDLFAYNAAGGRFTGGIDVPGGLDTPLAARCAAARDAFERWRTWLRRLPVAATVERVIDDAGLFLLAALAEGEAGPRGRAVAGLVLKYLERLRTDRANVVSIHDCLDLLDDMVEGAARAEFDPLTIDPPSTNAVRVMNLHKAKGLEAPVVFLVDFQKRKPGDALTDGPFLHIDRSHDRTTGRLAVTRAAGWSQRIVAAPPGWEDFCRRERAFEQAEQIRLDYVAATRAGSCLVVSLYESREQGKKDEPDLFVVEGAWERFGDFLTTAADLPTLTAVASAEPRGPAATAPAALGEEIRMRLAACAQPTFARISPRELLTEPAEGIRFTGAGLGEPWGRAIHRLLELAAHDPDLDLRTAAATVLSGENVSAVHLDRAVATVQGVLASDIWRRSRASPARFVETPFAVQVRGEDLPEKVRRLAGDGAPVPTVVRGVIDLVFAEAAANAWTIVDWKTDAVTTASEQLLADHYRPQVELYAECWRLLTPYNTPLP